MGDFFKFVVSFFGDWRRKRGVVTLTLALAVMGAWIRSLRVEDKISIRHGSHMTSTYFMSTQGSLGWMRSQPVGYANFGEEIVVDNYPYFRWGGFHIGTTITMWSPSAANYKSTFLLIPYWLIVAPFIMYSAYLLLGKSPHAKKPEIPPAISN